MFSSLSDFSSVSTSKLLIKHETVKNGRRRSRFVSWFLALIAVGSLIFLVMRPGCEPCQERTRRQRFPEELVPKHAQEHPVTTETPNGEQLTDNNEQLPKRESKRGFLIYTYGCKIPDLDPFDPAVRKYVKFYALDTDDHKGENDSEKIRPDCSGIFGPALVESNLTSLFLVPSALPYYNATKPSDVSCCYRPFRRIMADPENYDFDCDELSEYNKECVPFGKDGTASVNGEEFVRVECRKVSEYDIMAPMFYRDFHFFAQTKLALKRAEKQLKELNMTKEQQSANTEKWNVLILGIDAVSRLNFYRQMTKTKEVLEKMGAIEFLGYNKVGDNTFPNIAGIMTGLPEEELKTICWPQPEIKLDNCPWIWYNFTAAGYLTAYAEDVNWMSTFNYAKIGFLKQPVHLYLRPFSLMAESENSHLERMNARLCVGPRLTADMIFGYAEKIVKTLKLENDSEPFFGHFWVNSLSHDYLNSAGYMDDTLSALIGRLEVSGALEKTVLLLISDHGIRWGDIRSTYQGRMEERLPVAYVSLPQSMRHKYPSAAANFRRNARKRLTTPFDLHATLLDIIHSESTMTQEAVFRRSKELPNSPPKGNGTSELPRSVSLFLPIPEWRTCRIAGISPNWCCCHSGEKVVDTADALVTVAADVLMEKVNELVEVYPQCAKRNLVGIKSAIMSSPPGDLLPEETKQALHDLALVVESNPGSALFEATVRLIPAKRGGRGNTTFDMNVAGMISRINRYGNQSACVDEFHAKLYCYCDS